MASSHSQHQPSPKNCSKIHPVGVFESRPLTIQHSKRHFYLQNSFAFSVCGGIEIVAIVIFHNKS